MPITMTPKKSNRPQALNQARNTGPSDIMTAIKTIKLQRDHPGIHAMQAANPGIVQPDFLPAESSTPPKWMRPKR